MEKVKYILNKLNSFYKYSEEQIYFSNPLESFYIKGNIVGELFSKILPNFEEPQKRDEVIKLLLNEYDISTIDNAIEILIKKKVIIPYNSKNQNLYSENFIDNYGYEILFAEKNNVDIESIRDMKVAFIGNKKLVESLLNSFLYDNLIKGFYILLNTKSRCNLEDSAIFRNVDKIINIDYWEEPGDIDYDKILGIDYAIVALDKNENYLFEEFNRQLFENNIEWVRLYIDEEKIELGPYVIPKVTSCYKCYFNAINSNKTIDEVIYFNQVIPNFADANCNTMNSSIQLATSILNHEMNIYKLSNNNPLVNKILQIGIHTLSFYYFDIYKRLDCIVCYPSLGGE